MCKAKVTPDSTTLWRRVCWVRLQQYSGFSTRCEWFDSRFCCFTPALLGVEWPTLWRLGKWRYTYTFIYLCFRWWMWWASPSEVWYGKGKIKLTQSKPWRHIEEICSLHSFVTSKAGGGELSVSSPGRLTPGIHLIGTWGWGTQSLSWCCGEEKNLLTLPGLELRLVHPMTQKLIAADWGVFDFL
jgi:hypothetical protein